LRETVCLTRRRSMTRPHAARVLTVGFFSHGFNKPPLGVPFPSEHSQITPLLFSN
jgi:hypothetical protein